MKNHKRCCYSAVGALVTAAILAGCGQSEQQAAAPATPVAAMTLATSRLDLTEDLPGRVAAVRIAEIRPQVSGIVQRRLFEQGTEVRAGQALKVGNGTEPGVQQGPLIQQSACDHLNELVDDAVSKGARIVTGGKRHPLGGTFFEPTVITDATPAMRLAREELFGPVGPVFRFEDEAEAIAMANDTEYGLAAYLYTRDHGRIWRVGEALEYGMVGLNTGVISNEVAPFGGVKQSGLGREGSRYGIEEYLEIKYMCTQI